MPEFDRARINKIVRDINRFLNDLDKMNVESIDDLKDMEKFYAVSMVLFALINRTVDLGDEIVASLDIGIHPNITIFSFCLERMDTLPES